VLLAGLVLAAAGLALFSRIGLHTGYTPLMLGAGTRLQPALLDGYRLAFAVGAGCVVAAVLAALAWFAAPRLTRTIGTPSPQAS
jgi:hypothetical protein